MSPLTELNSEDLKLIEGFLDAIWLQSGLSDNTVSSYRADLKHFLKYLDNTKQGLLSTNRDTLRDYLDSRGTRCSRRTVSRSLSTIKRFYRYALAEELTEIDPSADIASPSLGKTLPKILSEQQVSNTWIVQIPPAFQI